MEQNCGKNMPGTLQTNISANIHCRTQMWNRNCVQKRITKSVELKRETKNSKVVQALQANVSAKGGLQNKNTEQKVQNKNAQ